MKVSEVLGLQIRLRYLSMKSRGVKRTQEKKCYNSKILELVSERNLV